MRGLAGRIVVVTGGAGGIGAAASRRSAAEGARVVVVDLDAEGAAKLAADLPDAQAFGCDISDRDQVGDTVKAVEAGLGPIDVLVNNAGWDIFRPFLRTTPDEWRKLIDVNLVGVLNMCHAVLPGMVERGYGRVVTVASDAARVGSTGEAVYAACKAGMIGLSKTLAREHARDGITFNVVCPGPTDTRLLDGVLAGADDPDRLREAFRRSIPMGRIGEPDDVAGAICFLAGDDAGYITGQTLSVSGGLTMVG